MPTCMYYYCTGTLPIGSNSKTVNSIFSQEVVDLRWNDTFAQSLLHMYIVCVGRRRPYILNRPVIPFDGGNNCLQQKE